MSNNLRQLRETMHENFTKYEESIGVEYLQGDLTRVAYLANVKPFKSKDDESINEIACLLLYFVDANRKWFKALYLYEPYFYIRCKNEFTKDLMLFIHKRFQDVLASTETVTTKIDLNSPNHLSGGQQIYLKLKFRNVNDLVNTRNLLRPYVEANKLREEREGGYMADAVSYPGATTSSVLGDSMLDHILEIREDDVLYHMRVMIDSDLRCAYWYEVKVSGAFIKSINRLEKKVEKSDIRVLAFDIETSKPPMKFPDAKFDLIIMISYIYEGQGFLIVNRAIVGSDVQDFRYTPKPEYDAYFTVFNESDEKSSLERFFVHARELKPSVYCSFNGDKFDWPFIEERCKYYGMSLEKEIGVGCEKGEYTGRYTIHMDCMYWVERDAYLPQGSHGLKAVVKAKLGYEPVDMDKEELMEYAANRAAELSVYSASDALGTYYLYRKMIHDFIFALCTIIPTFPDEVLRLGSGTLCEALLMAEAYKNNIIFPNKHKEPWEKFIDGHLLDAETYIGGHVEALKSGVYRCDFPVKFKIEQQAVQDLIDRIDEYMRFAIEVEQKKKVENCLNYAEVRGQIVEKLKNLIDMSKLSSFENCPRIYHVDVAAMYPNIILTNRLQPVSIVNDKICASCLYNDPANHCKREMDWTWKGDYFPLTRGEFENIKRDADFEQLAAPKPSTTAKWAPQEDKKIAIKAQVKKYCEKVYKKIHISETRQKKDIVCMRENPFYVDTVRAFRDRRYEYKEKVKVWKIKMDEATKAGEKSKTEEAEVMMSLFESLQLAHKIILNSFYGYVMRKGSRWYSMEMAAMVTHLGGKIITFNRQFLEAIGIPLELDTDGIWCLLPQCFPETYQLKYSENKKGFLSFLCAVLNCNTHSAFSNHQYQIKKKDSKEFITKTEMSVSFEIDGPYKCIFLPAAREEGKMLKKKYGVFNMQGKLQEIKGFEMKRRGELKIIKIFQQEVFDKFLEGTTLNECYKACAEVAERWYDVLESEGTTVTDEELVDYIGEEKFISKTLKSYGNRKSTAITCAKRLAEFLGEELIKGSGINTRYVIAKKPEDKSVAERAIPTTIFQAEKPIYMKYIKKWLRDENMTDFNMRSIIDWDYYKDRLSKTIQKIITIPAVMQSLPSPFPKVAFPEWLKKKIKENKEGQQKMEKFLGKAIGKMKITPLKTGGEDIEDLAGPAQAVAPSLEKMEEKKVVINDTATPVVPIETDQEKLKKLISSCPSPIVNYESWLQSQQAIWRMTRKLLKEGIDINNSDDKEKIPQAGIALRNYLKMQENIIEKSIWHILQITELPSNPGYLKVWFIAEHEDKGRARVFNLFTLNLHMKKLLYINSKTEKPNEKLVKKFLPRNKPVHNLYELDIEEDRFIEQFASFGNYLVSPDIEGIYESKIPLSVRAILLLGRIVRPKKTKITLTESHISQTFELADLDPRQLWEVTYLPSNSYDTVFISHSYKIIRHMWGIFFYATKEVKFFCVYEGVKQTEKANLQRIYKQILETYFAQENNNNNSAPSLSGSYEESHETPAASIDPATGLSQKASPSSPYLSWKVDAVFSEKSSDAMNQIEALLLDYKTKTHKPVIAVLQSNKSPEELAREGIPSLMNDFCVIKSPPNEDDFNYPALNWQFFAAKNLVMRFMENEDWLNERINYARLANLPLCNIETDALKYLIDMLYARKMLSMNHVLWYSNSGVPDLGDQSLFDSSRAYEEEIENPEVVHPGIYRGYCVEMNMSLLAINTILKSDVLNNLETGYATMRPNTSGATPKKEKGTSEYDQHDIFGNCREAFEKLKGMMSSWMSVIKKEGNIYADQLMHHIYRWLSSPSAKLYDHCLHKMVHVLMTKVFFRLIQKFKEHGSTIVYSSFHRLVIYTNKQSYEEALSYIKFILLTLKKADNELYEYIILEPGNFWRLLVFKDIYNYGGIQESQPNKISSNWNIGEHLPPAVEDLFLNVIAEFIYKLYKYMQTKNAEEVLGKKILEESKDDISQPVVHLSTHASVGIQQNQTHNYDAAAMDLPEDQTIAFMKKLLTHYFSQKLFSFIPDLLRKRDNSEDESNELNDYSDEDGYDYDLPVEYTAARIEESARKAKKKKALEKWQFPHKISSCISMTNPALEFVKFSIEVFSLEPELNDEVSVLRRNLLKMIKVGEFSQEAKYCNPSFIFVLPDVICDFCLNIRDIDICRSVSSWICTTCNHSYNKQYIEGKLLGILNRRVLSYQMQDLKCQKCKNVKNNLLSKYCECTGRYSTTMGKCTASSGINLLNANSDIKMFLLLLKRMSVHHQLNLLRCTIDQLGEGFEASTREPMKM